MVAGTPVMVGWREWVGLPQLGLPQVRAKIDSGARSCALHVEAQWRFSEAGAPWVGFRVRPWRQSGLIDAAAPIVDEREVSDSGGHRTVRPFIRSPLALAGLSREVDINLTDRRGMLFPMLIGRRALAGTFTVDAASSFLHGRRRRQPSLR